MAGIWISTDPRSPFWVALGSWVAVFPDTLEKLFGVGYGFKGYLETSIASRSNT